MIISVKIQYTQIPEKICGSTNNIFFKDHQTKFQDPTLNSISITSISDHTVAILLLTKQRMN